MKLTNSNTICWCILLIATTLNSSIVLVSSWATTSASFHPAKISISSSRPRSPFTFRTWNNAPITTTTTLRSSSSSTQETTVFNRKFSSIGKHIGNGFRRLRSHPKLKRRMTLGLICLVSAFIVTLLPTRSAIASTVASVAGDSFTTGATNAALLTTTAAPAAAAASTLVPPVAADLVAAQMAAAQMAAAPVAATTAQSLLQAPVPRNVELGLCLRLLFATLMGGAVGKERSAAHKHSAGVRTMALVSLGAASFTICSMFGFLAVGSGKYDPSRMASNVASGVGFVGAGVITTTSAGAGKDVRHSIVHGLTTATAIWISAAIGVSCGVGMYYLATFAAIATIAVLRCGRGKKKFQSDSPSTTTTTLPTSSSIPIPQQLIETFDLQNPFADKKITKINDNKHVVDIKDIEEIAVSSSSTTTIKLPTTSPTKSEPIIDEEWDAHYETAENHHDMAVDDGEPRIQVDDWDKWAEKNPDVKKRSPQVDQHSLFEFQKEQIPKKKRKSKKHRPLDHELIEEELIHRSGSGRYRGKYNETGTTTVTSMGP